MKVTELYLYSNHTMDMAVHIRRGPMCRHAMQDRDEIYFGINVFGSGMNKLNAT